MLKTISTALLAVSVLAAPALAAGTGKTKQAPVIKAEQAKPVIKAEQAKPMIKAEQAKVKPSVLKANAKMGRHHVRDLRHHRFHKQTGALKSHQFSKVTIKPASAAKRG